MSDTLIKVEDLCKIYNPGENEVRALDHVNLEIEKGEFVAIVGTSGSGKSTLLNMIGGLDVPTSGQVVVDGKELSKLKDEELTVFRRRNIGFIFQAYNLIDYLTPKENVALTSKLPPMPILEKMGLTKEEAKRNVLQLSGGQQQRVAIARAIAAKPPVILADEPTGNLDTASSKEILDILKELHEGGRTVILITHDNGIAEQAKRVVRIMDGKIESDTAKE